MPQVGLSWGGGSGGIWGFRPNSLGVLPALKLLKAATGKARYRDKVVIRMDMAASKFCHKGKHELDLKSSPGSQSPHHQGAALPELHQGLGSTARAAGGSDSSDKAVPGPQGGHCPSATPQGDRPLLVNSSTHCWLFPHGGIN